MANPDKDFEDIIAANGMQGIKFSVLTLGDIFRGILDTSRTQYILYEFIRESLQVLYTNSKSGDHSTELPKLTKTQLEYLVEIFELTNKFLREQDKLDGTIN